MALPTDISRHDRLLAESKSAAQALREVREMSAFRGLVFTPSSTVCCHGIRCAVYVPGRVSDGCLEFVLLVYLSFDLRWNE